LMATCAPSTASPSAMARPIPRDAPVTRATFPWSFTPLLSSILPSQNRCDSLRTPRTACCDAGKFLNQGDNRRVVPAAASGILHSVEQFVDDTRHGQRDFELAGHLHGVAQIFDL